MCTEVQQKAVRAMADAINRLGLIGAGDPQLCDSRGVAALYKALAGYQYTHGLPCEWSAKLMREIRAEYGERVRSAAPPAGEV